MRVLPAIVTILSGVVVTASAHSAQPEVRSINVNGSVEFTAGEILSGFSTRPGRPFVQSVLAADIRSLKDRYLRAGYFNVRVDTTGLRYSQDSSTVSIAIALTEGRRTVVGTIHVRGAAEMSEEGILRMFETAPGNPLDQDVLERDIEALLQRYERRGYPFVSCMVDSLEPHAGSTTDSLDLHLRVEEGKRMTIDEILVEGNRETDPAVVVRETRFRVGEQFDPVKVDAIRPRLQRLNIFSDVSEPELYLRDEKGGLRIRVREGSTNTFDGVIGYLPATTAGQSGYLSGLASVSMRNLFGTGRKFSLRWQRENQYSQELALRYVEPWVGGFPVNLDGGFFQRKQDTAYVRRVLDLKAEFMVTDELSIAALVSSENVIPSDTTGSRVLRTATLTYGVELQYDSRDDPFSPTSGAKYGTDYHYGSKRAENVPAVLASQVRDRTSVQRLGVDLDFYVTTFLHQVVAMGLHGRDLEGDQIDEGSMFRFGGMRTLRGYRENEFLGSRVAWSNTEYRFLLARRSFLYGFLDTGYYLRPADDLRGTAGIEDFKYGYGIGLQVETGLGNIGVSFALGKGDSFGDAKVHFGLINDF